MNFKKAINYDELKVFFESKGFSVKSESGGVVFSSPYGYHIAVSQSRKDEDMIYLDCNLDGTVVIILFLLLPRTLSSVVQVLFYVANSLSGHSFRTFTLFSTKSWLLHKLGFCMKKIQN